MLAIREYIGFGLFLAIRAIWENVAIQIREFIDVLAEFHVYMQYFLEKLK